MRIVIDMQGAQSESRFRGIGRYTMALVQAMVKNRGKHQIILALSDLFPHTIEPIRAAFEGLLPQSDIRVWQAIGPVEAIVPDNQLRGRAAELLREAFLESLRPDFVLVTSLFEGLGDDAITSLKHTSVPTAIILYDLIPLVRPQQYLNNQAHRDHYYEKLEYLKRSTLLLAISEGSRQEALTVLPNLKPQIVNISGACNVVFHQLNITEAEKSALLDRLGIQKPFVMYTGGVDWRKNLPNLIQAYAQLPSDVKVQNQLVFVGKIHLVHIEELKAEARKAGLTDQDLIFTGYVSDEELAQLYNLCRVFVFPSLHEGFGLPPLEAMACGAPTIASNVSSLPEIVGLNEALFDPNSVQDMQAYLRRALEDETFRSKLIAHGTQHVQKFSWNTSAKLALKALEDAFATLPKPQKHAAQTEITRTLINDLASVLTTQRSDPHFLGQLSHCMAANENNEVQAQLLLDVSVIAHSDSKSGIQRVVRSLLHEFMNNPPAGRKVTPIYFDNGKYRIATHLLPQSTETKAHLGQPVLAYRNGDTYLSMDLNIHIADTLHPVLKKMRAHGVEMHFIVYDLLPYRNPQWWFDPIPQQFCAWLKSISILADQLICISAAVADEMKAWLEQNHPQRERSLPRVSSFHLGADLEGSIPSKGLPPDAVQQLGSIRKHPTFISVGTLEPRKGQTQLLDAMEILWDKGVDANLVFVGKLGWMVDDLAERLRKHPQLNKKLFWLEGISDEYLEQVYTASSCLVAPSLGEGFGLPLIEAAQKKIPILARDLPVFREVAGTHASYFAGEDAESLAQSLENWLQQYWQGTHQRSDNMPWLTWKDSANQLLSLLLTQ